MENEMLSLYDYLGKAAGMKLGEQVFKASKAMNLKIKTRTIDIPTYCGEVMLYPKEFLDLYFKNNKINEQPR